jgi:hypothetical protein
MARLEARRDYGAESGKKSSVADGSMTAIEATGLGPLALAARPPRRGCQVPAWLGPS